jgi:hypothetical protein
MIIATDSQRFSNVIKHEYNPSTKYCRELVTVNEAAAKTYTVGMVLGKVTATGKYKISVQSASDGSQNPVAIVVRDSQDIAATTDTKIPVIARGPVIVSKAGLVLDATFNDATKKAAAYASLQTVGILANDAV